MSRTRNVLNPREWVQVADWLKAQLPNAKPGIGTVDLAKQASQDLGFYITGANVVGIMRQEGMRLPKSQKRASTAQRIADLEVLVHQLLKRVADLEGYVLGTDGK